MKITLALRSTKKIECRIAENCVIKPECILPQLNRNTIFLKIL